MTMKESLKRNAPPVYRMAQWVGRRIKKAFPKQYVAGDYWERRYRLGGTSAHWDGATTGDGARVHLEKFKASVINSLIKRHSIRSAVEFGCGDGYVAALIDYPSYLGVDIAPAAVEMCRAKFAGDPTKQFQLAGPEPISPRELALSLDVIYHLVDDAMFSAYMTTLFDSASRFVAIHSSNMYKQVRAPHVRHRKFSDWIAQHRPEWSLSEEIKNPYPWDENRPAITTLSNFYIYERRTRAN